MRILLVILTLLPFPLKAQTAAELVDIGYKNYELGDYKEAIEYFDEAAKLDSKNPEIFYLMGVCKSQSGRNTEAIIDYNIALKLDPDYAEVHYEKGYALFLLDQLDASIKSFDMAIALKENYSEAWFNRGSIKCIKGDVRGAKADWDRARELGAQIPEQECEP
ncbi:MAG: tetratricopeptide repeat protein [Bacteroidota bacterium]